MSILIWLEYAIVYLLMCTYCVLVLPENRQTICADLLADVCSWRERFSECDCVIAGDFDAVLDDNDAVSLC